MSRAVLLLLLSLLLPYKAAALPVKVGAQVLKESGYREFAGKRVGLITNHTALVEGVHVADLLARAPEVKLSALLAPEHGLRGSDEDGVAIAGGRDPATGVPVYSLYGKVNKPTPDMLRGLDLLVFDIQDIGARFYTYISTMGLAMQAAAASGIPFVVLDRPNPLGGDYMGGAVLDPAYASFEGRYPVPVAHGLTVGELALMIKGERMLPGLETLDLRVVGMEGWRRAMQWPDTGLPWVRTSPNIPDFETALLYPGSCYFEATAASEGRGTREPFRLIGFPGVDGELLAKRANECALPGVRFEPAKFTPQPIPGMSTKPKFRGRVVAGVRILVTDARTFRPVETGITLVSLVYEALGEGERKGFFEKKGFDRLAGTGRVRSRVERGAAPQAISAEWEAELKDFALKRQKYLLYR